MSQLLSILVDFDDNPPLDTRGVFLDISKAFYRVQHDGLIFKLKSYGVSVQLSSFVNYLSRRLQRVVLDGQASE